MILGLAILMYIFAFIFLSYIPMSISYFIYFRRRNLRFAFLAFIPFISSIKVLLSISKDGIAIFRGRIKRIYLIIFSLLVHIIPLVTVFIMCIPAYSFDYDTSLVVAIFSWSVLFSWVLSVIYALILPIIFLPYLYMWYKNILVEASSLDNNNIVICSIMAIFFQPALLIGLLRKKRQIGVSKDYSNTTNYM